MFRMRRRMGMLFQFGALFTDLSVFDNVAFPLREHTDLPEALIRDIVLMKLNAVGLRGAASLRISEVSGGMARRIALARAIALDPQLIMYDEPFAGLDLISMGVAANLIRTLNDVTGATSLVVSHDVPECMAISDYVVLMAPGGRIVAQGLPSDLMNSTDPEVRQFVRGEPDGPVKFHYPAPSLAEDFDMRMAHEPSTRCAHWATRRSSLSMWSGPCPRRCVASASSWRKFMQWATCRCSSSWLPAWQWASCSRCRCTTRWSPTVRPSRWG
jgi:phospholipid/cholesterol/gamma-HCH transport system ATP-binding protein